MSNRTIQIISRHATLTEAVEAAKIDLSYNEREARRKIRDIEAQANPRRPVGKSGEAFVTEIGVLYLYHCDITLLNKFDPFIGCISNSPFHIVNIDRLNGVIHIIDGSIPKTLEARRTLAKIKDIPSLAVTDL